MRRQYRLTEAADQDIDAILRDTVRLFGPLQRDRYADLIEKAALLIAVNPERPGSRDREDLAAGVRSFHVELAAGRRGAASHTLFYIQDPKGVVVVRVLHDGMEPMLHIGRGLEGP